MVQSYKTMIEYTASSVHENKASRNLQPLQNTNSKCTKEVKIQFDNVSIVQHKNEVINVKVSRTIR